VSPKQLLYDWTWTQMVAQLDEWGFSKFFARQLWHSLYRDQAQSISELTGLDPGLRDRLSQVAVLQLPVSRENLTSEVDGTRKHLLEFGDGQCIETVVMHFPRRVTVCVSTQIGCAMDCVFCATGQMGFTRHLTAGEIVAQVMFVLKNELQDSEGLRNIVLMGMGEPLHNLEATIAAIDILTNDHGLGIGPSRITVSTVGLPKAIRRLADLKLPINLAVSLHALSNEERNQIVPINKRWNISQVMDACVYYIEQTRRRIFFEWTLIDGWNDSSDHAKALGLLLDGLDAHVNLIPLNPTERYDGTPSKSRSVRDFQQTLNQLGIPSTVRRRMGIDIGAGCGQLRNRKTPSRQIPS